MAEQVAYDVVKEAQSVGRSAPIDDSASTTSTPAVNGELPSGPTTSKHDSPQAPSAVTLAHKADAASTDGAHVSGTKDEDTVANQNNRRNPDLAPRTNAQHLSNGDSSDHSASESQAVADASGGSDTDISRPGSVDQSKREQGHVRTNSTAKKPSTFKSVSVTKAFLAKSVVSTPAARPGEKAPPTAQTSASAVLTPKPRLVAKLGTSNTPRTLGKANGTASGPDASKVWNKNQPVPPPPPKQYTDEELKQQYGIHLATRLQTDEGGKEAKWADIDDDEDDWAPDTVQWMDGTKSSVAVAESQPPAEDPKTILKPEPPVAAPEPAPATPTSTPKVSVTGGTKTILKPGAHAQPPTGKTSLVLKGQPEKPTLVAKPSATEKKSPWATLPPVEKVSPVPINPPAQHQSSRYSQRESYSQDSRQLPAQEIAPDDFNRTWRDERGNAPELYNSHSGRYEPVNEMRRPSARDAGFRQQPSVLQRPSQGGPAEPSAAFQTSRANGDAPTWGRRRNSSNVSAGNLRRMSIDRRGPDMPSGPGLAERRGSQMTGSDSAEGPARQSPFVQATSPNTAPAHPASPYGSVASSAQPDHAAPSAPAPPAEDPVEVQKRLMADKIERARLKKQQEKEAEQKDEAERKERIAKKLAALAPPAAPKSKAKEQSPSRTAEKSPPKDKAVPATIQSPPKPPVPTADGEIAQYGMMKVHQPHTIKKSSPQTEPAKAVKPAEQAHGSLPVKTQTDVQSKASPASNQPTPQSFDTFTREPEKSTQLDDQSRNVDHVVSAGPKPQAPPTNWAPATAPQSRGWTSQVWGPPATRDRALGNGSFVDPGYSRGQSRSGQQQMPAQSSTSIAPIGHSLASQATASHGPKQLPSQAMYSQPTHLSVQPKAALKPGPIAPPLAKGWGNFEADIANDDRNMVMKALQDRERIGEQFRPELRETYKDQRGQAQTTLHTKVPPKVAPNVVLPEATNKKDDATKSLLEGSPQQTLGQGTPLQQATGPRASRFFPRPIEPMTPATTTASAKADSPPPPPETSTHPVFSGDCGRPQVKMPKPPPVVRLPPSATGSGNSESSVSMPQRGQQPLGSRPLAMNPEWQARFNKLLEKPGTTSTAGPSSRVSFVAPSAASSAPGALAPTALSKASLEVRSAVGPATVSLPNAPQVSLFATDRGRDADTRKGTEALFEDPAEPAVSAPKDDLPPRFKKQENPFTIRRLEAFDLDKNTQKIDVVISLPGMRQSVTKSMPRRRRGAKTGGPFKPKQTGAPNGSAANNSKDRPRKPSQQGQAERPNSSARPAPTNAWSNNGPSNPAQPQTTWARRAAAAH
ncbi:hypothetical protein T440DRAFT_158453 [Plenodomus tracheiphilus IPT5]|uniref:Uncharacterized protein n=1 Tax=Plenodomus tracheiphilus IPT5 TaxID=1408161 RepID=A0A6A7BJA4_9PLEO|nr:hypothetical protein T440DRAFT_158453 [Plenodomus tracheiphilus IPT5]